MPSAVISSRETERRVPSQRLVFRLSAALAATFAVLLVSAPRVSALVPPYAIEDLATLSSDVVVGTVVDRQSDWQEWPWGGRVIMTTYTVSVGERLKGEAPKSIAIVVPGGKVGDTTILASDCPELPVGGELVLFLRKDMKGLSRYWIFGLERGAWELDGAVARSFAHDTAVEQVESLRTRVARVVEVEDAGPR